MLLRMWRRNRDQPGSSSSLRVYQDALYLWSGTMAATLLGFVFWAIVARLYETEDVGRASALISAILLLGSAGSAGVGFGLIRFRQPTAAERNHVVNWSFTAAIGLTVCLALLFVAASPIISPGLAFLLDHPLELVAFVAFSCAAALNLPLIQLLLAEGRAEFAILANIISGSGKVIAAAALYTVFEAMGMVVGFGVASWIALIACILLMQRFLPGYKPALVFSRPPPAEFIRFSLANHLGWQSYNLPTYVMPIVILNLHGEEASAYFYVAWIMGGIVASMASAISQALFSRGSQQSITGRDTRLAFLAALFISGVFALFFLLLSSTLLSLFGREYADASLDLLRWVAVAAIPTAFVSVYYGVLRIAKANTELLVLTSVSSAVTIGLGAYLTSTSLDIAGVGVAYLVAQSSVGAICLLRLLTSSHLRNGSLSATDGGLSAAIEPGGSIG